MRLDIVKANPSGNTTILVLTPVEKDKHAKISRTLMELFDGWAEQVGFVSGENMQRLDMMGGEFCGNATLSLAACRASRGFGTEGVLSVSGADKPVETIVRKSGEECWYGRVQMPLPESVSEVEYAENRFLTVRFPGMTHVIVQEELAPEEPEATLRRWASETGTEAAGMLILNEKEMKMRPLVYVRDTDSMVWEHGCASGTAAVGAYMAVKTAKSVCLEVSQPGGVITVNAETEAGKLVSISIGGSVRLEKTIAVDI